MTIPVVLTCIATLISILTPMLKIYKTITETNTSLKSLSSQLIKIESENKKSHQYFYTQLESHETNIAVMQTIIDRVESDNKC